MKRLILLPLFFLVLGLLLVIKNKADQSKKEAYVSQVIIDAPWGENPGQFGIYEPGEHGEEGPQVGPDFFSISPNGDIYICDVQNHCIQRFSNQGELISVIPTGKWIDIPADLCVDKELDIYILYVHIVPSQVWKYDQNGNVLKKYKIYQGAGPLFCDTQGRLFIGGPKVVYQFGTVLEEFTLEQQRASLREGFVGSNNVVLNQGKILQTKEGELHLAELNATEGEADSNKSVKKFSLYRLNLYPSGTASFTGVDEQMNVYTFTSRGGYVIRKYNPSGDLVAEFSIEKEDYIWTSRSLFLDEHGNIYVMSTSEEGLKIIKWSPVEGGN